MVTARIQKRLQPLEDVRAGELLIHEIYASIQGESTYAGLPCTFVRTTACNLRCSYCDTVQAFKGGESMSPDAVFMEVERLGIKLVELTGGEPLLQQAVYPLMTRFCDAGYTVLLETSGSLDISKVDARVIKIVDFKTPSSRESEANDYTNVQHLAETDEVKFVLGSREDYEWARALMAQYDLSERCHVLMGTVFGRLEPRDLVDWIVEDKLDVRMQLQMHKYIWDPKKQGV